MSSSRSSNPRGVLLVAAGAVAGSLITLLVEYWVGSSLASGGSAITPASGPPAESAPARTRRSRDHATTLSQILAADDREHKSEDLRHIGHEAASSDHAAALKLAARIRGDSDRADFIKGVVENMADKDPRAAADFSLKEFPKGALQADALRIALSKWGAADPRGAYAWSEEHLSGPVKEEAFNSLVQSWAARSPQEAAKWFEETGSVSQPLLGALLSGWAGKAPREAAQWVETLPNTANRDTGRILAAREWATQSPEEAAAFYKEPAPDLAGVLANIWGNNDPAAAARWIGKLPAGPAREEAAGVLATVWAASDINAAVQWSSSLSEPSVRAAYVEHLAGMWSTSEPDKALTWVSTQPPDVQERGYISAYNSWAGTDKEGLADWITQLPAGAQADIARRSLAEVRMADDPAAALDLVADMTSASQADAAGRYFRNWRRTDEAAAREWLQTNWTTLAESTRDRLTKELERALP